MAQEGDELVFVEVRTRSSSGFRTPEESASKAKVRRLVATAQDYMQNLGDDLFGWRVDLVSLRAVGIGNLQSIDRLKHTVQL